MFTVICLTLALFASSTRSIIHLELVWDGQNEYTFAHTNGRQVSIAATFRTITEDKDGQIQSLNSLILKKSNDGNAFEVPIPTDKPFRHQFVKYNDARLPMWSWHGKFRMSVPDDFLEDELNVGIRVLLKTDIGVQDEVIWCQSCNLIVLPSRKQTVIEMSSLSPTLSQDSNHRYQMPPEIEKAESSEEDVMMPQVSQESVVSTVSSQSSETLLLQRRLQKAAVARRPPRSVKRKKFGVVLRIFLALLTLFAVVYALPHVFSNSVRLSHTSPAEVDKYFFDNWDNESRARVIIKSNVVPKTILSRYRRFI